MGLHPFQGRILFLGSTTVYLSASPSISMTADGTLSAPKRLNAAASIDFSVDAATLSQTVRLAANANLALSTTAQLSVIDVIDAAVAVDFTATGALTMTQSIRNVATSIEMTASGSSNWAAAGGRSPCTWRSGSPKAGSQRSPTPPSNAASSSPAHRPTCGS